ncbi:acyltransferase family protein [Paenirhodobacter populi]|nr:acyltransferase family protein [Sinirhodobacter populi]
MYLKEIQGFRVIAALLVAIYHVWFHRVSGGVDAFFVIAGFFLMHSFAKQERPGMAEVLRYWQRCLARIAPSASVVILATCVLFLTLGTDMQWSGWVRSAIAALLMVENWWLMRNGVNYLSIGHSPSPFQQMWALSVQMQIYLLLPLAVAAALAMLERMGWQRHRARVLAVVTTLAFAYALLKTHQYQPAAYFNTFARVWEFLAGGLLALIVPKLTLPRPHARILGYLSLVVLAGFAALIPVGNAFPGMAALIPVAATAGVIISARNGGDLRLLNNAPMQWLGNLSFTFYLWHWPLYILVWNRTGSPDVGLIGGLAILATAFVLSVLTWWLAERPFRQSPLVTGRPVLAFSVCALAMMPAALGAGLWWSDYTLSRQRAESHRQAVLQGAPAPALVPATLIVRDDIPVSYRDGCYQSGFRNSELVECSYGNQNGATTVVLAGGSHSLQWLPALQRIAAQVPDLRIVNLAKSGCTFTLSLDGISVDSDPQACLDWNRRAIARIREIAPRAVITTGTRVGPEGEILPEGYRAAWDALAGIPVLAIRDNPRADFDIAACVSRHGADASDCTLPRNAILRDRPFREENLPAHVVLADLSDAFCDAVSCAPTRDSFLIYRDSNHLTATYAARLAPRISAHLNAMRIIHMKFAGLISGATASGADRAATPRPQPVR